MKKFYLCLLSACIFSITTGLSQTVVVPADSHPAKSGQNILSDDIYLGYGGASIFYFTGKMSHKPLKGTSDYPTELTSYQGHTLKINNIIPSSFGTLFIGYARNLSRVVSWGVMFGFQDFTYTEKATEIVYVNGGSVDGNVHTINNNDILLSGIGRFLFTYINKPTLRIYSGIGLGITVNFGKATMDGEDYSNNKLWPGGEITFMGVRFGKAFGGFFEFGFGSYGIINAGVSYKFAD